MIHTLISIGAVFIELWITFLYYSTIFDAKRSKWATVFGGLGLYLIPVAAVFLINNTYLNTGLYFLVNTLFVLFFYNTSLIRSIVTSSILTALMTGSEFITLILFSILFHSDLNDALKSTTSLALLIIISKTILFLLSIFVSKIVFRYEHFGLERSPAFLFVLPISALFLDFTFWIVCTNPHTPQEVKNMVSVGSAILLISILLTYVFYGNALRRSKELFQLQQEYEKVEVDKEYYNILDHQNEELRTFIHDEKSHLTALQTMSSLEEMHAYVNHILGELQYASSVGSTKNKMLDLILGKYTSLCKMNSICFSYTTITANLSFMADTDLVSLMSNILDNAVEAAKTAEHGLIELSLDAKVTGMTILTCKNNSGQAPVLQSGKLKTSKQNEKNHGIGIKSIIRTVKKYDGNFEWTWDDHANFFTVTIVFER